MNKIVIVGGVAGGATAAARLRRLDENAEIIMFEKGGYISFANCGLPYHISETIAERKRLIVQTPEAMKRRFEIDIRNNSEVTGVDTTSKTVTVHSEAKGDYTESYDTLILAPGVLPIIPVIKNMDMDRVLSLRTMDDMDRIKMMIAQDNIKSAVIIGGGYIGVETAENLRKIGIEVTMLEAMEHILAPFDSEFSILIENELKKHGVDLVLTDIAEYAEQSDKHTVLTLKSGKKIEAELIICAIGGIPATGFLAGSGITLGPKGHIVTNDRMQTNVPDVYAVGDAVEVKDFVTGKQTAIPLAGPANKQGRIAADNICGIDHRYMGTQGTAILKVFDLTAASTGANERTLKRLGIDCLAIYTHPFSHATYYPESAQMSCKLLFDKSGRILGCQIVGTKGVDKRIDVVATVIRLGGTVYDLCDLELAYAPPFSSAKDPVNMLGYIAQNILEEQSCIIDYNGIEKRDTEKTVLIDVRTPEEFDRGHIEGALNIPVDELRGRLNEIDRDKEVIEYCQVGLRGHIAERILSQNGYKVKNMTGGWKTYSTVIK